MHIHEAVKEALKEDGFICRKSAREYNMSIFGVIKPTNTYDTCLLLVVKNGEIDKRRNQFENVFRTINIKKKKVILTS